ncbi:hypothetical protein BGX23_011324 [Mortierella sp. AD031]|nr:hypothetical protein BGX23_011324 [Mortierella sp. AD031]
MQSQPTQDGCQAVYALYNNVLSAVTAEAPMDADIVYIDTHSDSSAGMEIILWNGLTPRTIPRPVPRSIVRPTAQGCIGKIAAHVNLKVLQEKGEGDQADFRKALECYLKGVKKGHAYAHFCVGKPYLDGKDVPQSYSRAMEWFLRVAG